jgi:predicted RND superfamily exporter protein
MQLFSIQLRDFSWRQSIILTVAAVGSPMVAMFATFSLLGWMGVQFNSIMSISPFLILGIGVDDAFLLLHGWRKYSSSKECPADIMERVLSDTAPSVVITSLTNVLAFSIGIFSPANQLSSFCLCTTIAVALDFVLEFTLFAPCLALTAPLNVKKRRAVHEERY